VPNKTNHLDWENTPQSPELVYSISSIMGLWTNYQNHLLITISSYSRMLVKSAACLVAKAPSVLLRTSQIPGGELGQWRGAIINLPRLWPFMLEQPGDVF
jgi:hypothetical protein